jgi:hypothetical protein
MIYLLACFLSFYRNTYRLGDGYFGLLSKGAETDIIKRYPDSILSEYLQEKQNGQNSNNNSTLMYMILKKHCQKYVYPHGAYTAIHLRTGDVVCGHHWHEREKRPHDVSYYQKYRNQSNVYIFSKPFFSVHSSKPCIRESIIYINKILKKTKGTLFASVNADHAFCAMIKAFEFISGKGYFSKAIVELNKFYKNK